MSALYQQQYALSSGAYYGQQAPKVNQYGRAQKPPIYMMNDSFSGYGYPNYVMYPSAVGGYIRAGPSSVYQTTENRTPGQYQEASQAAVYPLDKKEPESA